MHSFTQTHNTHKPHKLTEHVCARVCVGGAPLEDIRAFSTQNISMDIATFISLKPSVLTV